MSSRDLEELAARELRVVQLLAMLGLDQDSPEAPAAASQPEIRKPEPSRPPYVMVAAIDFGTTFSGYAFSFIRDKHYLENIKMNKNWGSNVGFQSYKTPTCVLLDSNKDFVSFGFDAQHRYAEMFDDEAKNYYYFEKFKMKLHETKDLVKSTKIHATNGSSMSALDIFSMALHFMKMHLIDAITHGTHGEVDENLICWVITVPAIWSDASKQFMREAALKAGLIDKPDSHQLLIALEPEAASLFVRKLEINQFIKPTDSKVDYKIKAGAHYLVIDAGGGTLDVTAHEFQEDGKVKELHFATGGAFGGTRVDGEFVKLMKDIFGKEFLEEYRRESAANWLTIMNEFERKKRIPKPHVRISIPFTFATEFEKKTGNKIDKALQDYTDSNVKFSNGMICISESKTKELFQPVLQDIVAHIEGLLKLPQLEKVDYFFCVGGFSECSYFQEALKSKFSDAAILIPEEASLSVVKGAVQFGHDPDSISSRISAKTYGVETMTSFIPFIHNRDKALPLEGKIYCKDLLEIFVNKGDEVAMGFTKTISFVPVKQDQHGADVEIYSAAKADVMYITDEGVDHHGKIHVNWPGSGLNRKLEICMTFGSTEVEVEATSYPGGNKEETKLDFLTD